MFDKAIIHEFFEQIIGKNIAIIGDVMLDHYLIGVVNRISPEAPVPVVDIKKEDFRLGGAANVALNLKALGANPYLIGLLGNDSYAERFKQIMREQNIFTDGLITTTQKPTTVKTRIIGNNQQILRVDQEDANPISTEQQQLITNKINESLNSFKIDAIIFEDYDKGVLNSEIIEPTILKAIGLNIPTLADPKFKNFFYYKNVTVFKPNLKELSSALHLSLEGHDRDKIKSALSALQSQMPHHYTVVTLSDQGMMVADTLGWSEHFKAHLRKIKDVSGAGDTVISVLGACLAVKVPIEIAVYMANIAGGLVCEEVGVVPISSLRLKEEALRLSEEAKLK